MDFFYYVFIVIVVPFLIIPFLVDEWTESKEKTEDKEMSFEVVDDTVIKYTPMPEIRENVYKTEVVMTKEIFQECYKKWVMSQESEDKK